MNRILLTSTALVAFAGAAAADGHANISYGLSATLGYNNDALGDHDGFYWDGNLKATATAALDNGLTAGAYFEVTIAEDNLNQDLVASDFVVSLTSEGAGLYFGDTGTAATKHWVAAGDMESDGFTTGTDNAVLRGDYSIAGFDTSLSFINNGGSAEQLSFGAGGSFGAFTVAVAYQAEAAGADTNGDFNGDEVYGVSAGGTFAGATVTAAYAANTTDDTSSAGVKLAYPFGPVTATVYYVLETGAGGTELDPNYGVNVAYAANGIAVTVDYQDDQTAQIWSVNGSYDLGNGLTVIGGAENNNEADVDYYVGATYDLGGGASVLMTYAEDADDDQGDEIGSGDYQDGLTVAVSFEF